MGSPEAKPGAMTRRQLLRLVALSAAGAGLVLGARGLVGTAFPAPAHTTVTSTASSSSASSTTVGAQSSSSSSQEIKVKVMYFQMPLVVSSSEEYFVIQSPAYFRDLMTKILEAHPALSPMIPTMMIMIDGLPAKGETALMDGAEVDFIPTIAGG